MSHLEIQAKNLITEGKKWRASKDFEEESDVTEVAFKGFNGVVFHFCHQFPVICMVVREAERDARSL